MRQADRVHSTRASIRLSELFTDPLVRAAFRRAEDDGHAFAVPASPPRTLEGGAAVRPAIEPETASELDRVSS
jgi:hypothetical protein